ncbi:hypothetical protein DXC31_16150, partial [Mediterraneibacter gnavus]
MDVGKYLSIGWNEYEYRRNSAFDGTGCGRSNCGSKGIYHPGGIANMGSGTANITIKGNEGQTLVGKKFHVYKLFLAQNAQGMESINYTFNPTYEQALKNVAAKALSVPVDEVTEYMVIDYIQSLNSYKVEGAQTEQELEGRYSKFRYFVEDLRNEIEKQG